MAAPFEVEHSTSIYSGIVPCWPGVERRLMFTWGPSCSWSRGIGREAKVRAQLSRPAFSRVADPDVRYVPHGELEKNWDAIARFSSGLKGIEAVSRRLV